MDASEFGETSGSKMAAKNGASNVQVTSAMQIKYTDKALVLSMVDV
jgi:hypothetical protein